MSTSERTPTPWRVTDNPTSSTVRADRGDEYGAPIAEIWENGDNRLANAAFIVQCVNAHDELVEALEEIVNPVKFMRDRAEADGRKLDGAMAYSLANDIGYLRGIARAALEKAGRPT